MSGGCAGPGPGSGSSPAAFRFAHYFVLCGIDADSGLEPDELAGKAGAARGSLRDAEALRAARGALRARTHWAPRRDSPRTDSAARR
ncbi:DENN domain-containing protein 5B [Galemys pyrenaicus]|uniref:DENN domain-containing protein 5B n=1 Tax=Galemys pyrenaicus TaxID=202257 RepID=A0A8J6A4T4_GALPY|nr:DENN domain-containing protein 5B [Galemys pyrenaicus]